MISLSNYPLKLKLLLVPSIAVASFAVYLIFSSFVLSGGDELLKQIRDSEFPKLNAAGENIKSFDALLDLLKTASSTGETSYLEDANDKSSEILHRFELMGQIDFAHKKQIDQMKNEFVAFYSLAFSVAQTMTTKAESPGNLQLKQMQSLRNSYFKLTVAYKDAAESEFQETIRNAIASSERAQFIGAVIGTIMLFIIGMLTMLVNRGIVLLEKTVDNRNKMLTVVNNELQHEIRNLKAAEEARNTAEVASQIKDEFLANMSHELRTPMSAVIGLSHLCLQTDLSSKQQDYVRKINSSAKSLLGILNDILDISKIEAGKMELDMIPFELTEEMDNISTLFAAKSQEKNIDFLTDISADIPFVLIGDPLRLGQILINLAGNALKFTATGKVVIRAELVKESGDHIELKFSVIDTGIGLSQIEIGKLFRPFTQADSSITRKFGGTGLGLTISKRLVEMMGGKIWVESVPGSGSKFIFSARFLKPKNQTSIKKTKFVALRGLRVLAVDDNDNSLQLLKKYLESFSLDVAIASNDRDALSILRIASKEGRPILLAIFKLKSVLIDGVALAKEIQTMANLNVIPKVLLITEFGQRENTSVIDGKYVHGIIEKPLQKSTLFDAVAKIIGRDFSATGKFMVAGAQFNEGLVSQIRGAHLLLVEDNEINQQIAKEMLESFQIKVTVAENGVEAIEKLNEFEFDGILMDMQMTVMDGISATREIRKNPKWANLPIIALTANVYISQQNEILAAGMNDHVGKPIDSDNFLATLAKWVRPKKVLSFSTNTPATKPLAPLSLPDLPGIKVADSIRRMGGSVTLYYSLLEKFKVNQKNVVQQIRDALATSDLKSAERISHTLRGIAGSLGAESLQHMAHQLEINFSKGALTDVDSLLRQLELEVENIIVKIDQAINSRQA